MGRRGRFGAVRTAAVGALLASMVAVSGAIEAIMGQFSLATVDPLATCNDGTPGMFYFRRTMIPQQRNLWVVRSHFHLRKALSLPDRSLQPQNVSTADILGRRGLVLLGGARRGRGQCLAQAEPSHWSAPAICAENGS